MKNFCDQEENHLFCSKFINEANKWAPPKKLHLNSVCFKGDFYNLDEIQASLHNVEQDIVERKAFWYERNFFQDLLEEFQSKSFDIAKIPDLAFVMLSLKHRNPRFRNGYKIEYEKHLPDVITKMRERYPQISQGKFEELVAKAEENIKNKPIKKQAVHNNSILQAHAGQNEVFNKVHAKLMNYKIVVYSLRDENERFIVSDAPGFSVDNTGKTFDTKYVNDLYHFLPLSFNLGVAFVNPEHVEFEGNISYQSLNSHEVFQINYSTGINRTENLYAGNSRTLEKFIENVFPTKQK